MPISVSVRTHWRRLHRYYWFAPSTAYFAAKHCKEANSLGGILKRILRETLEESVGECWRRMLEENVRRGYWNTLELEKRLSKASFNKACAHDGKAVSVYSAILFFRAIYRPAQRQDTETWNHRKTTHIQQHILDVRPVCVCVRSDYPNCSRISSAKEPKQILSRVLLDSRPCTDNCYMPSYPFSSSPRPVRIQLLSRSFVERVEKREKFLLSSRSPFAGRCAVAVCLVNTQYYCDSSHYWVVSPACLVTNLPVIDN